MENASTNREGNDFWSDLGSVVRGIGSVAREAGSTYREIRTSWSDTAQENSNLNRDSSTYRGPANTTAPRILEDNKTMILVGAVVVVGLLGFFALSK